MAVLVVLGTSTPGVLYRALVYIGDSGMRGGMLGQAAKTPSPAVNAGIPEESVGATLQYSSSSMD